MIPTKIMFCSGLKQPRRFRPLFQRQPQQQEQHAPPDIQQSQPIWHALRRCGVFARSNSLGRHHDNKKKTF
jgi:hypothetical protein